MKRFSLLRLWFAVAAVVLAVSMAGCGGSDNSNSGNSELPRVVSVTPNTAPTPGPTTVTIIGNNFSNSTSPVQVMFGKDMATSVTIVSDTQITAIAPAKTGGGDVRVITSNGTSAQTINDVFADYPIPIPAASN